MLTKIEVKNYKLLRYISQPLSHFHILVGANATGKTTFLDILNFVQDIVNESVEKAVLNRTNNFDDLTWKGQGGNIEFALEFQLPTHIIENLQENKKFTIIRYEIKIGIHETQKEIAILGERVLLLNPEFITTVSREITLFPDFNPETEIIFGKKFVNTFNKICYQVIINKTYEKNDIFSPEISNKKKSWNLSFKLGHKKSALANLPADEEKFPASTWIKEYLNTGIQLFMLNSLKIREASRPNQGTQFKSDGSNLPWVIDDLQKNYQKKFKNWIEHIQTALPDIKTIKIIEQIDNKHKYLKIIYRNGAEVPSWIVSDGTLRLLALTIIAYLPDFKGIYLIEEPENGIHPKAIETIFQSLQSTYNAQILVASHSPTVLSVADIKNVLCFAKTQEGIADIINGNQHPNLKEWKGETNLSTLFASGILD